MTSSLVDSSHPATLWTADSSQGYFPPGEVHDAALGNGLTETNVYQPRLQPCQLDLNSSDGVLSNCNDSTPNGNIQDYLYTYGTGGNTNNGNVTNWVGAGQQNFNRTYTYGSLNRLTSMSAPGDACSGLSWTYDAWGNRNAQSVTGGSCPTFSNSANSNNQLTAPYQYDAAGNMTADGTHTYFYDAENRLIQVDGTLGTCSTATACYVYNAEGERAQKTVSGVSTDYHYDAFGRVVAEYDGGCGSTCWNTGYVYVNGALEAEYRNSTTYFVSTDHLSSTRIMTGVDGSVADSLDFLPYGEQIAGDTFTTHKFTGKERDSESGLDNFGARYNSSSIGRFMSADPGSAGADIHDPQSWKAYSYVRNSPVTLTDPSGKDYTICTRNEEDKQTCTTVSDDADFRQALANPGPGITVQGTNDSGTIFGTDANGNQVLVGTYEEVNGPGTEAGGLQNDIGADMVIGGAFGAAFDAVSQVGEAFISDLGRALDVGRGQEALGSTAADTQTTVDEVVARANSAVGHQSVRVSSEQEAQQAADRFLGPGARPISGTRPWETGEIKGWVSADGQKVVRMTHTDVSGGGPHWNFVNKLTGGNVHVYIK